MLTQKQLSLRFAIAGRVDLGVELLDGFLPTWRDNIDTERLNLGSDRYCVLGQLFGSYADGVRRLGLAQMGRESFDRGFLAAAGDSEAYGLAFEYKELTAAWKKILKEHRSKTATTV